ncbi:MAG: porin [Bacteroidota bacterium]|nr:porin [Bacteroidota bacterium]
MKKYAFILILFLARSGYAQTTNDILNVLVQRKLVTQEEADSLRADDAIKQQEADAKKNSFQITAAKKIQLAGYSQVRYQNLEETGKKSGFDIRRARLDFKGNISPYFGYRLQSDFGGTSVKLLDAFAEVKLADYFNLTIGQQKVALSYENQISDNKSENIDRSQVVEALVARSKDVIGNHNGRDIGVQANGSLFKINDLPLLDYYVGLFNGAGINTSADNNSAKDVAARLVFHPVKGLDLGGSYYDGVGYYLVNSTDKASKSEKRKRWGLELSYEWNNLTLHSEYLKGKDNVITRDGYYVQLGYFILPQKFQAVGKYDSYDPNKDKANDASKVYTLGVNYFFNPNAKVQLAYNFKEEQGTAVNNNFAVIQFQIGF